MTETKKHIPLRIEHLPDGGFVVSEASWADTEPQRLFASTSIGEALAFIEGRLDPGSDPNLKSPRQRLEPDSGPLASNGFCPECGQLVMGQTDAPIAAGTRQKWPVKVYRDSHRDPLW